MVYAKAGKCALKKAQISKKSRKTQRGPDILWSTANIRTKATKKKWFAKGAKIEDKLRGPRGQGPGPFL